MDQDTTGKSGSRSWRDRLGIDEQKPSGSDSTPARAEPAPRRRRRHRQNLLRPRCRPRLWPIRRPWRRGRAQLPRLLQPPNRHLRLSVLLRTMRFAERLRKHREAAEEAVKKRSGSASLEKFSFAKKEVEVAKAEKSPPASAPAAAAPAPAPTAPAPAASCGCTCGTATCSCASSAAFSTCPSSTCGSARTCAAAHGSTCRRTTPGGCSGTTANDRRHRNLHNPHTGRSSLATLVRNSHRHTVRLVRDMHRLQGRTWHHREDTRRVVSPVMGRQPLRRRARLRHLHKAISARRTATMICFRTMAIVRRHRLAGPLRSRPQPSLAMTCAPGLTIRSMTLLPAGMAAGLHAITRKPIASSTTIMKTMNQGADGAA
jgi:hypothetical protein